jgi:hypothetical protein
MRQGKGNRPFLLPPVFQPAAAASLRLLAMAGFDPEHPVERVRAPERIRALTFGLRRRWSYRAGTPVLTQITCKDAILAGDMRGHARLRDDRICSHLVPTYLRARGPAQWPGVGPLRSDKADAADRVEGAEPWRGGLP